MSPVKFVKSKLLRFKPIKDLNRKQKIKRFYSKGIQPGSDPETILFWTTGGMLVQTNLEGAVAAALKLRGKKVHMVLCDGVYKGCARRVDHPDVPVKDWGKYCSACIRQSSRVLDNLGVEYSYISDHITLERTEDLRKLSQETDLKNYKSLSLNGYELGNNLESAMMRHTRGGAFEGNEEILKEYAFTVLVVAEASSNALNEINPGRVYMSHGIYADWGPALTTSLKRNIPVNSYICCYLNAHFYFGTVKKMNETFLTLHNSSWEKIKKEELNDEMKNRLLNFLSNRYKEKVSYDMRGILKDYRGNTDALYEKYGLVKDKPVWGIMTHINWDAVSDYFPMIHRNFDEWLGETIKAVSRIDNVQWLIKIHPSELNDNPETGCQKYIENNFPDLPSHIKVIKMDDDLSPLDFYNLLNGGVTVMGTAGLELAIQGKPVILAGDAHYSGKGFTYDGKDRTNYEKLLSSAADTGLLDKETHSLALKYAYTYFIRKQIPMTPTINEDLHIDFGKLDYLLPGKNKYMDFLCDRILDGEDFVLPEGLVSSDTSEDKNQIRQFV
ncbi:MAG: hypothetical protein JSS91_04090 [Bacteroidetes bacterium]|nr:hypothetical protein [Bacteroidota bacterium]